MAYKSADYQKAIKILEKRREKSSFDAAERRQEILQKLPEIDKIQIKLSQIGLTISESFFRRTLTENQVKKLEAESLALQRERAEILKKNGYDEDALSEKHICPACKDTGYYNNHICTCHMEILKEIQRDRLRAFAPVDDFTFDSFDTRYYPAGAMANGVSPRLKAERILENCRTYAQNFNAHSPNLIFMGKTGLGKTHLSIAIANVVINKGFSVTYGSSPKLFSDLINESFGRTIGEEYSEQNVLNTDLLIIDDLGTELISPQSIAVAYNVINTRILKKKPTIISTNFDFKQLDTAYDSRITSRISGDYSALILEGEDIRHIKK